MAQYSSPINEHTLKSLVLTYVTTSERLRFHNIFNLNKAGYLCRLSWRGDIFPLRYRSLHNVSTLHEYMETTFRSSRS